MSPDEWGHLQLRAPIPEFVVRPDRTQIFMFSAVTWNRHRIHYDKDAAIAEGLPDVVAQRGLIGNFFARMLTEWMGDAGEIRELRWKVTQSALPDLALRCAGEVVTVETVEGVKYAACTLRMQDESGRDVATGEARVHLF